MQVIFINNLRNQLAKGTEPKLISKGRVICK